MASIFKVILSTQTPAPPQAQAQGDKGRRNLLERAPLPGNDRTQLFEDLAETYAPKGGGGTSEEGVWYYARLAGRPAHAGL